MYEFEPKRENVDQKPFIIRAHHFFYFAWLVNQYDVTPQKLAKRMISWTKSSLGYILASPASQRKQKEQEEKEYEEDVLGVDLEHADENEKHLIRTFEDFLGLPDNYPSEIVEGIPDIICAGCAVGKHCRTFQGENTDMDEFLRRVSGINHINRLRGSELLPELAIQKQILFFDAEPLSVRKISTTLGTVKKVLTRKPNEESTIFRRFS